MIPNMQFKRKFLVVSYDINEQQWFYDFVIAKTEGHARAQVFTLRPYVIAADAVELNELQGFVETLGSKRLEEVYAAWEQLKSQAGNC